jgi:hypothetical protein
MTIPPPIYGKTTPGLAPGSSYDVNYAIGTHLRSFIDIKEMITHDYDGLAGIDLKAEPYNMSPDDETLIKSAINGLHTALEAVDMTFINRLVGLW